VPGAARSRQDARTARLARGPGCVPSPAKNDTRPIRARTANSRLEAQDGERKAAQRRCQDLPGVGHRVEAPGCTPRAREARSPAQVAGQKAAREGSGRAGPAAASRSPGRR
jgi:hypothetical protein